MADIKYLVGLDVDGNINLNTKELQFASIHPLAANPTSPTPSIGQTYWNTANDELRVYNGTTWISVGADTNYDQWQITDGSQTDDVTSNQIVKFAANATAGTAGAALTGTGTNADPYLITYTFPNDNTEYTADVGLTLAGTQFSVNVADSQTTQVPENISTSANRLYQVETDDEDMLVVNVPWTDTNVVTYDLSSAANATDGVDIKLTGSDSSTDTINIIGTANEVEIAQTATNNKVQIGLPDDVTIAGELTVSGTGQHSFGGQVTIPTTPTAGTDAASKAYVDAQVVGGLVYQGGYDASTNTPALDISLSIGSSGNGGGPTSGIFNATTTTGTGSGMTIYVELNQSGNITTARVVDGGDGLYTTGSTVSVASAISGHSGSFFSVTKIPVSGIEKGWTYTVTADGYFYNEQVRIGDVLIAEQDDAIAQEDWTTVQNNIDLASLTQVGIGNVNVNPSAAVDGISLYYSAGTAYVGLDITNLTGQTSAASSDEIAFYDVSASTNSRISVSNLAQSILSEQNDSKSLLIGNSSLTTIPITAATHGLGSDSSKFLIQLIEASTGATVHADVIRKAAGAIDVVFNSAPATNAIRVLIHKTK